MSDWGGGGRGVETACQLVFGVVFLIKGDRVVVEVGNKA